MMISQYFTRWIVLFFSSHSNDKMVSERNGEEISMARLLSAVVCASLVVSFGAAGAEPFILDCTLPFESIKKPRTIDGNCPVHGDAPFTGGSANDSAHALQNLAKNNFCATGTPALVTFISFKRLQQKLDKKVSEAKAWNQFHLPGDRNVLLGIYTTSESATIGEGSIVKFAAWLIKLRKGGNESCNCGDANGTAKEMVDMHLVLISSSERENAPECKSVTAEISPHFRPDQWDGDTLLSANDHPLRFTGQLMYDASHRPCSGSPPTRASGAPSRVSSWEIHPVYAIDVCAKKSLRSCKADNDSVWTPLDQWQGDE
jgi:hypothetical protein